MSTTDLPRTTKGMCEFSNLVMIIQLLTLFYFGRHWRRSVRFHVFIAWVTYCLVICQILTFILQTDILILEEAAYCDEDKFPLILLSFCCLLLAYFLVHKVTLFVYVSTILLCRFNPPLRVLSVCCACLISN